MAAFVILLFFCLVCGVGGCALRRADRHAIEEDNERYYTPDGYHVYYDRKILRRLYPQDDTASETNKE